MSFAVHAVHMATSKYDVGRKNSAVGVVSGVNSVSAGGKKRVKNREEKHFTIEMEKIADGI